MPFDPQIKPGMAPGGLVFRVTRADGVVLSEEGVAVLYRGVVEAVADRQGELAAAHARPGAPSYVHVYDGDSGECVQTVVVSV